MANIEKNNKLKKESLNSERYLESILMQGYNLGMLTDGDMERIQFECLALLAKQTERYNSGDSSSIRIEKAQDIFASIMFTVGVHLKIYHRPDDAVIALQNEQMEALYHKGLKRIDDMVKRSKMLHAALLPKLIKTENEFYHSTAADGIQGFFKLYSPDFGAQEIHITADYPVYNKAEKLLGIEFIHKYLEQIYHENQFCAKFAPEVIHHLLCGYNEKYKSLLFNLYEPVLAASLGCILAGVDEGRLEITSAASKYLYRCFLGKKRAEIEQLLSTAFLAVAERFLLSVALQDYVKQSLPLLAITIENAVKTGTLDHVFIKPRYPENNPRLVVSYGEKMENALYRKVLDEFMGCESITDKIDVMREYINSLADLNDLLLDAELSVDEVVAILNSLSPPEITVFFKKYTPQQEMSFTELRDSEKVFCEGLRGYLASLSLEQQMLYAKAVAALEIEGEI